MATCLPRLVLRRAAILIVRKESPMSRFRVLSFLVSLAVLFAAVLANGQSVVTNTYNYNPSCNQTTGNANESLPPTTTYYIQPRAPIQGNFQWQNMLGYCGEVTNLNSAAAMAGTYMNQYNARGLCGTGLSQSGWPPQNDNWCKGIAPAGYGSTGKETDNNAEVEMENDYSNNYGITGPYVTAEMISCARNEGMQATEFPYWLPNAPTNIPVGGGVAYLNTNPAPWLLEQTEPGEPGFEMFMSWVKQEVIAGHAAAVSTLDGGGSDPEYDHETNVTRIGTNHDPSDPTYYPDDVICLEAHGANVSGKALHTGEPSGANGGCTVYEYCYTFASVGATRAGANVKGHKELYLLLPGVVGNPNNTVNEVSGGASPNAATIPGPSDLGVSISGPIDTYNETLPVQLIGSTSVPNGSGPIYGPTYSGGVANKPDLSAAPGVVAGFDYDYPEASPSSCTNSFPASWMTNVVLQPYVSGLTPGVSYNLYEYQFATPASQTWGQQNPPWPPTWQAVSQAALPLPYTAFNANSAPGGSTPYNMVTNFTATGSTYMAPQLTTISDEVVVYRAVPASGGIYNPANNSTLPPGNVTFAWDSSASVAPGPDYGATAYWLDVGPTQGGNNYYQSGSLPTATFAQTVSSLPTNGTPVWARWYYLVNGQWLYSDFSYTAYNGSNAGGALTTPTPNSTLTGNSAIFYWTEGTNATAFQLDVSAIAPGGNEIYQSGNLGLVPSTAVNGLPTNGNPVYVTLWSMINGVWVQSAYTYNAFNAASDDAAMISPLPSSGPLSGSSATFSWTAGSGATDYWLDISAVAPGGNDVYQSGATTKQSLTVNGLPISGTVYVTLYTQLGGQWFSVPYVYATLNASSGLATINSPTGPTLSGSTATFGWTSDANATAYWLDISAIAPGGNDVFQSGSLSTSPQQVTVYGLPANGSTIYLTMYSLVGGQWYHTAATYTSGP
jgi:hypothetical protein